MTPKHTNNELTMMIENQELRQDEKHQTIISSLERIETQVKYTNGRVTTLEKFMWAVVGVTSVFTALIIPVFLKMIK